jgi:hypothetical protein
MKLKKKINYTKWSKIKKISIKRIRVKIEKKKLERKNNPLIGGLNWKIN